MNEHDSRQNQFEKQFTSPIEALRLIAIDELHETYRNTFYQLKDFSPAKGWLFSHCVYFSGLEHKTKNLVSIYGVPVLLTNNSFVLLTALSMNLYISRAFPLAGRTNSWTHATELFDSPQGLDNTTAKYLHRLKTELREANLPEVEIFANNNAGSYSVLFTQNDLVFNLDRLSKFPDVRISAPASRLSGLLSRS